MEWMTLNKCYELHNKKLPMTVMWSSYDGEHFIKIKEVFLPNSEQAEWFYLAKDGRTRAILMGDATLDNFRLKTSFCSCDYRNVILVTGCRCGVGYE